MKKTLHRLMSVSGRGLLALVLAVFSGTVYSQSVFNFSYTGSSQTVSLPPSIYSIECWGADGGTNPSNSGTTPGKGGYSKGSITLTATTVFTVYVGGKGGNTTQPLGGFNSGNGTTKTNISTATGGGGASDIRVLLNDYYHRIIVAGGGGGQGTSTGTGGHGGGLVGQNGQGNVTNIGIGGTQTLAGVYPGGGDAKPATFGEGGDGPAGTTGGQGGGGWYGGSFGTRTNGGGGGGSGYVLTSTSYTPTGYFSAHPNYYFSNAATIRADESGFVLNPITTGNGFVRITELCSIGIASSSGTMNPVFLCAGNSLTLTTDAISNYSWSTGATTSSIVVAPTTSTLITVTGTSSLNCTATGILGIFVSSGLPVLSISNPSNNVCLGAAVTLSASGALTYTWTGGITNGQSFVPAATQNYTVYGENGCGISSSITSVSVAPLAVSASVSQATICAGNSTSLSATSAVTGFTWEPGTLAFQNLVVTPAANTIYTVTASDGTCSGTATVAVNTIPIPTLTAVATDTDICEGDVVTLSATGAQSYAWSPGNQTAATFTDMPLTATLYNVVGTAANGCTSSAQQAVNVKPVPVINITSSKAVVCVAGGANLTASGAPALAWVGGPGTPQYSVNPVTTSIYSVVGTAVNQCTAMATYTVGVFDPVLTVAGSSAICPGQSATMTATGGNNNTYSWNGGPTGPNFASFSPATSTVYLVTAQSSSAGVTCPANGSHSVTVYPQPNISVVASKTVMCRRDEVPTLTANGGTSYLWLHNNATANTQTVTSSINGTVIYQVIGYDANNCEDTASISIKTEECVGLKDMAQRISLSVYPNPSNGNFVITAAETVQLSVINETGQLVAEVKLSAENGYRAELKDLAAGVYFLTGTAEGSRIHEKIIVTR